MKICIIGSGNIASFYGIKFKEAGHEIIQVISRTKDHAARLASLLNCKATDTINDFIPEADVIVIAVKDDAIQSWLYSAPVANHIVIHTAGAVSLNSLEPFTKHVACIWCLLSVRRESLPLQNDIPLVVNATTETARAAALELAAAISNQVYELTDEQKHVTHLAAVFANNFSNHLLSISETLLNDAEVPFEIILPMLEAMISQLKYVSPQALQTGPAIRHDQQTIDKHLSLLNRYPHYWVVYDILTKSIQLKSAE